MIKFDEFKSLMRDLSIKTGKTPTAYGKAPDTSEKLEYMLTVYHKELRHHEYNDIIKAFNDKLLIMEISNTYSLSVGAIEKYIQSYRTKRTETEKIEEPREWITPSKKDIKELIDKVGVDISNIS